MKRLSVFVQLYLMLLLVLIMPVSLVVFYATNTLGDYAKDEVAQSTLEKLISSANAIELMMVNIVNGCIRFSQNNSFLELRKVPDYESLNMDTDNIFIAYDAVSYTHLDVYKRQIWARSTFQCRLRIPNCAARCCITVLPERH